MCWNGSIELKGFQKILRKGTLYYTCNNDFQNTHTHTHSWKTPRSNLKRSSLRDSGGGGRVDTHSTFGSPLLVTSPPHSPRPQTPIPPSSHSPPHCLHTGTLSPRRHFSPLHRSVNATSNSTPSRLYHSTSRPRQVISNTNHQI